MTRLLAALAILASAVLSAVPGRADQVYLTGEFPGKPSSASERAVFPEDVREIHARIPIASGLKTRVEFKWLDPDGRPYQHTLKMVFPVKGQATAQAMDTLEVAGSAASDRPGWWVVEAGIADKKLSARFLLTKSRQVLALAYGEKKEKLDAFHDLKQGNPGFRDLVMVAMEDPDDEVRAAALVSLGGATDEWALQRLLSGQEDASPLARVAALGSLLSAGTETGLPAASRAASDSSPAVRRAVAEGLLPTADDRVMEVYKKLVRDPDQGVRNAVLRSLSKQEGMAAFQVLVEGLKVDNNGFRRAVIDMVASKSGPGKVPALAAGLSVADPETRLKALKALSLEKGEGALEAIRPLIDDPDARVARQALQAAEDHRDIAGLEQGVHSKDRELRKKAVQALLGFKDASGARGLAEAMNDDDLEIRLAALKGLITAGPAGVPGLLTALTDKDSRIRSEAASSLDRLGVKEAGGPMLAALGDPEAPVRSRALNYFIQQGGAALPSILGRVACDPDPDIRATGLGRLAAMPGEASSRALKTYMDCGDTGVRQAVVEILVGRDDTAAMEVVKSSLRDRDPAIRRRAATRLHALGVDAPLAGLASDPDPGVRRVALQSMEAAPDPDMLPVLGERVKDDDESVRLAALGVLKKIPGEGSSAAISLAVKDGSRSVSELARALIYTRRDEGAASGLYEAFLTDPPDRRENTLAALDAIPGGKVDGMLYKIFTAAPKDEKVRVLNMLARRRSELLAGALKEALLDRDVKVRMTALDRAKDIPGEAAFDVYMAALSSEYPDVREVGIERLGARGGEAAAAALTKELDDPVPGLRKQALSYLVSLGEPSVPGRLARLVRDSDPEVRRAAFDAALMLPDTSKKTDALLAAAGGPYQDLAQAAVDGLLPLDDARALPFYLKFFSAGYRRHDLLVAMARIKGDTPVEAISAAYDEASDDGRLRIIAVESLAGRGVKALPCLSGAVSDPSASIRIAAIKAIKMIDAPGREEIIGRAVTDGDREVRREAFTALKDIGGPASSKRMLPGLDDPEMRDEVLTVLVARRSPEEQDQLASYAATLKDEEFKAKTLDALAENGSPPALVTKFAADADPKVRRQVAKALSGCTGPEAAYGYLLIGADEDSTLRGMAAKAVGAMKPVDIKGGLDLLFDRGHARGGELSFATGTIKDADLLAHVVIRAAAAGNGSVNAALGPVISRHASYDVPALMEGLKAADAQEGKAIARALAACNGPDVGRSLREAYAGFPDIRGQLIRSAGENGRARDVLPLALKDGDAANRREAAKLLAGVKDEPLTSQAVRDPDEAVRLEAAAAAAVAGYESVLTVAASDASAGIRIKAARGLGDGGWSAAWKPLTALAVDPDKDVSAEALGSLQRLGDKVPSAAWAELASSTGNRVALRLSAMSALAGRKEPGTASVFAKALGDSDPELKKAATDGLRGLGAGALPALYPLLKERGSRMAALDLLSDMGDATSEGPVLAGLPDMDNAARVKAVGALGRFGGPKSLGPLASTYKEGPDDVRNAVVIALGQIKQAGEDPKALGILSDALGSTSDSIRYHAAHSAAALKARRLKGDIERVLAVEQSALIKDELTKALNAVSEPGTP